VVDVSQDGACEVHKRFMHHAMPMPDGRQLECPLPETPCPGWRLSPLSAGFRQDQVPQEQRIIGDDKYGDFSGGSSENLIWTFGYLRKPGH
jgi:hypothetical protein